MNLCDVKLNQSVRILSINCKVSLKQRLQDLGLVKNTVISPIFIAPLGNPIAYEFRGNIIAIRKQDSKYIVVD